MSWRGQESDIHNLSPPPIQAQNANQQAFGLGSCSRIDDYTKLTKIAEGTFGVVWQARHNKTGELVAVKRVKVLEQAEDGFALTSLREIQLLRKLRHENIVTFKEIVVGQKLESVFLVFEYCPYDLARVLQQRALLRSRWTLAHTKCIMRQLLKAIQYIHENNVIHRDLKPGNLLLSQNGVLKLADFGMARRVPTSPQNGHMTPEITSLWYRAPEICFGNCTEYSSAVDIWSVGCIFAELLCSGHVLFEGRSELQQLRLHWELLGYPDELTWPGIFEIAKEKKIKIPPRVNNGTLEQKFDHILSSAGLELLRGLLQQGPSLRLSAQRALEHEFFIEEPLPCDPQEIPVSPSSQIGITRMISFAPSSQANG